MGVFGGRSGAEREVEDEKAGGRGEMKRERIHNEWTQNAMLQLEGAVWS